MDEDQLIIAGITNTNDKPSCIARISLHEVFVINPGKCVVYLRENREMDVVSHKCHKKFHLDIMDQPSYDYERKEEGEYVPQSTWSTKEEDGATSSIPQVSQSSEETKEETEPASERAVVQQVTLVEGRVGDIVKHALPYTYVPLQRAERVADQILAVIRMGEKTINTWKIIPLVASLIWGFLLLFFGKRFVVTFSIFQAFKHGGSDVLFNSLNTLREQARKVGAAQKVDDEIDLDNNGIPDIMEMSRKEFAKRKIRVATKAVEPKVLQAAFRGLWTASVSATASVKVEFARTVTLGITLGDDLNREVTKFVLPATEEVLDLGENARKWLPSIFGYACRIVGVMLAVFLSPVLYAVTTSVHGAFILMDNGKQLIKLKQLKNPLDQPNGHVLESYVVWAMIALGLSFQLLFVDQTIPASWWMKVAFAPLFVFESFMSLFSSFVRSDGERVEHMLMKTAGLAGEQS